MIWEFRTLVQQRLFPVSTPQNIIQRLTICISLYLRWQCGILHISNLELKYRYAGTLADWMYSKSQKSKVKSQKRKTCCDLV